jgi:hypothetical protein
MKMYDYKIIKCNYQHKPKYVDPSTKKDLIARNNKQTKIDRIMKMLPELRKYFSFSNIKGISEPNTLKRPYLSIINQVCNIK